MNGLLSMVGSIISAGIVREMKDPLVEQKREIEILLALRDDLHEFEQHCLALCQRALMEQHQEDLEMFASELVRT